MRRQWGPLVAAAVVGLLSVGIAACSVGAGDADGRIVDVYAASSLTDAYSELEDRFELANPGVDVRLNLAGSNTLLRQILDGAEADVYAPASVELITDLDQHQGGPQARSISEIYASNRLTLVVPDSDDKSPVTAPTHVIAADLLIARCASGVPCGDATDRYLEGADLALARSTDEPNVRAVLLKVASGEVDAGYVYSTDARARADEVTEIPLIDAPTVDLALTVLTPDSDAAAFAAYVVSDDAVDVFRSLGFIVP